MAKVMVVDDSAYARRVHSAMLERAGHSVIEAATGSGAIEMYCHDRPDVVLLDLSMEDIGGLDVLRTLREIDPAARVVVVSADVQRSTESSVMAAGARQFVGKPANEARLVEVIAALGQEDT
jgi:two-component system chemotaxis response regulator CheY